jgi:hypothetical protein
MDSYGLNSHTMADVPTSASGDEETSNEQDVNNKKDSTQDAIAGNVKPCLLSQD